MAIASRTAAEPKFTKGLSREQNALDTILVVIAYIVLILVAISMFVPFIFSVATSLKTDAETVNMTWKTMLWANHPTWSAYHTIFQSDIGRWFFNSAVVAAVWVIAHAVFDAMAGYAFARMRFPGRNFFFILVVSTLMVPSIVTIIPKYILLLKFHLINSYGALMVPYLSSAFGIFLMKQFFESIPSELEEAARVDGASRYRMFAQIILPNAMPAVTALAVFSFQGSWNAFLEPLIFISNPKLFTLPLGLAYFNQAYTTEWPTVMAIAVISTLPIAFFYIIFQRWITESSARSGIKG